MRTFYHLLAVSLLTAGSAVTALGADDTDRIVVSTTSGSPASVSLTDISQITFAGDSMTIATLNGGENIFKLTDIESITFDLVTSSADNITANLGNDVNITVDGGIMTVSTAADAPLNVTVYNLNGILVTALGGQGSVDVDFNPMPAGVYIVKANNKTIKFIR